MRQEQLALQERLVLQEQPPFSFLRQPKHHRQELQLEQRASQLRLRRPP